MKEINPTKAYFNDIMEIFDGKTEFVITRKGNVMNLENDIFVGKLVGTTKDPNVAHILDNSKARVIGMDMGGGLIWDGEKWYEERGKKAYAYNKEHNPEIFIYEATNVKTGEKIKLTGQNLLIKDFYGTKLFKLVNKIEDGYKISKYSTHGEIDGKTVAVNIVPRICKLNETELAEFDEKARIRKENAINRIKKQLEAEKEAIIRANKNIMKLEEKLQKLVENA
jgi:hypothetical protein